MSNNKQSSDHLPDVGEKVSSIDWLHNKMYEHRGNITIEEYEQAKAMHKEEIESAFDVGCQVYYNLNVPSNSEHYYNQTFNHETK